MTMCANHPEVPAAAYCRECGKPLCGECRQDLAGVIYCAEHVPASAPRYARPATPPPDPGFGPSPYAAPRQQIHPGLALGLGTLPGVGAIYNGQYAKGLIHAVIFGLLISIVSSGTALAPLIGILIFVWWAYMVLEAYHTARKRRDGLEVDEFSSLINFHGSDRPMAGALVLIGLGVLFLLNTTGLITMEELGRYWPVLLIAAGVWMLYARASHRNDPLPPHEFSNERR